MSDSRASTWPDGSALGARFRMQGAGISGVSNFQIAGVSRLLEADRVQQDNGEQVYITYMRLLPTYNPLGFVARVDNERRLAELGVLVRSMAPRTVVWVDTVTARCERLARDTKLAAASTSGFGIIALIVAAGGIYAVMAFIVAARGREIAIRMALGADRAGTRRLILRSSLTFASTRRGHWFCDGLDRDALDRRAIVWRGAHRSGDLLFSADDRASHRARRHLVARQTSR